jgi:hypothetical protein
MRKISRFEVQLRYGMGKYSRLLLSIIVDIAGMATYGAPVAGEVGDIIWAFISFSILKALYSEKDVFNWAFWEEVLPLTDIIPSGCLSWYKSYYKTGHNRYEHYLERIQDKYQLK